MRETDIIKENLGNTLKEKFWALHFDSKRIDCKEIQFVILKDSKKEIKLEVLLPNGKK